MSSSTTSAISSSPTGSNWLVDEATANAPTELTDTAAPEPESEGAPDTLGSGADTGASRLESAAFASSFSAVARNDVVDPSLEATTVADTLSAATATLADSWAPSALSGLAFFGGRSVEGSEASELRTLRPALFRASRFSPSLRSASSASGAS